MPSCVVKSCQNYTGKKGSENLRFFRFPADPIINDQWKVICKNENINVKNGKLNRNIYSISLHLLILLYLLIK